MSHEPGCPTPNCNTWGEDWGYDSEPCCHCHGPVHRCICSIIRSACQRGRDEAGEVAADLLQAFQEQRLTASEFIEAIKSGGYFTARGGEQE